MSDRDDSPAEGVSRRRAIAGAASPALTFSLAGDGTTRKDVATPKVLTGGFSGSRVQSVTKTVTWN